ncbi:MAG: hypothetical protein WCH65_06765 [bacterium]
MKQFGYTPEAIEYARSQNLQVLAAEITPDAMSLSSLPKTSHPGAAVIF